MNRGSEKMNTETSTPEEDEAFNDLDKRLNPEPDFSQTSFAKYGRLIEHLGKVMQDKGSTIHDVASASQAAGLKLLFKIQP